MRHALPFGLLTLTALPLVGCTTTLSTMQPAAALKKGDYHAAVGTGGNLAPGPIVDAFKTAKSIADDVNNGVQPDAQDEQDFLTAALAIALNPPGVENEFAFRYGLGGGFDLGLRYTINSIQLEGKYQFLDEGPGGWAGSIGLGFGHHIFAGPVFDVLEFLQIDEFSRNDISVPLMFGRQPNDYVQYWLGPKYIASRYKIDAIFEATNAVENEAGAMQYFGGTAGFALGYRYVWFMAELTVMNLIFNANVLGEDRDLGGVVIYPAGGLMVRF
jgi:hypothetical protein